MLVLEKGLAVIECFDGKGALTVSEVAALTGLSRAAARRCLLTLERLHYARSDGKAYRLAPRVLRLGYAYLSESALPQLIQPVLDRVSATLNESCSAAVLEDDEILYIARAASAERVIAVDLRVGARLPAFCTSMGRVLLAAMPSAEAGALLRAKPLPRRTPFTLTDPEAVLEEIGRVAEQGYSVVEQELDHGLVSLAVPVIDAGGNVVAALNLGMQAARATPERLLNQALPHLLRAQAELRPLLKG
ncbi:helix-turn-helix domain-containing protein [Acetobacteraceae bacterium H6797]|nr:helix-turn-helix domain-containing protein [Acetobacteraceae bacterium H6797]